LKRIRDFYEREALSLKDHQRKMYLGNPWNRFQHGTRLSEILKIVKDIVFRDLLEVGCAEGHYLKFIANTKDSQNLYWVGLDIAKNYLIKAKKRGCNSLILGDAHNLPFRENSFDLVLCSELLEHLVDPKRAFMETARVSRRHILISVAGENLFAYFLRILRLMKVGDPYAEGHGHINEMKISEIVFQWSPEAGCKAIRTFATCYFPIRFLRSHKAPSFLIHIIGFLDRMLGKLAVIKELATTQIALLAKSANAVES